MLLKTAHRSCFNRLHSFFVGQQNVIPPTTTSAIILCFTFETFNLHARESTLEKIVPEDLIGICWLMH